MRLKRPRRSGGGRPSTGVLSLLLSSTTSRCLVAHATRPAPPAGSRLLCSACRHPSPSGRPPRARTGSMARRPPDLLGPSAPGAVFQVLPSPTRPCRCDHAGAQCVSLRVQKGPREVTGREACREGMVMAWYQARKVAVSRGQGRVAAGTAAGTRAMSTGPHGESNNHWVCPWARRAPRQRNARSRNCVNVLPVRVRWRKPGYGFVVYTINNKISLGCLSGCLAHRRTVLQLGACNTIRWRKRLLSHTWHRLSPHGHTLVGNLLVKRPSPK